MPKSSTSHRQYNAAAQEVDTKGTGQIDQWKHFTINFGLFDSQPKCGPIFAFHSVQWPNWSTFGAPIDVEFFVEADEVLREIERE